MKRWVLAAALIAAAGVPPVAAADLGDGTPPPWEDGGYYGEPRLRSYAGPPPSYDDDENHDDAYDVPERYARERCVRSEQVRRRLTRRGWYDFHAGKPVHGDTVTLRARRPSGRLFELKLDRCSGDLVATRPVEQRSFGPYAYREPQPRRHRGPDAPPYADDDRWQGHAYRGQRRWNDD